MDFRKMIQLWPQYQSWLKQNNINRNNIQSKVGEVVSMLKQDPEKANQVQTILNNPETLKLVKQYGGDENQFNQLRQMVGANNTPKTFKGNLTQEQLNQILGSK